MRQPVNDPLRVVRGRIVDSRGRSLHDAIVQPKGILFDDEKHGRVSAYGTIAGLDLIAVTNKAGEFEISYKQTSHKGASLS